MRIKENNILYAIFTDPDKVLKATETVYKKGANIIDVFTPFPIHHLDKAMGIKRTRLPIAAFCFGATGFVLALIMQSYMNYFDWPILIGGKPFASFPSWVPVCFEATILCTAFGMVATFFFRTKMLHGVRADLLDMRQTDDKMVLALNLNNSPVSKQELIDLVSNNGAVEIREREGYETKVIKESNENKTSNTSSTKIESSVEESKSKLLSIIGKVDTNTKDDLKEIVGIGEVFEKKLNELGIYTFEQLTKLDNESISIVENLTGFQGRVERENWIGQAKEFISKK